MIIREEVGDRSFWLILPGFMAVFFGAPLEYLLGPMTLPRTATMQIIGLALLIAGVLLRVWVRRALGGMYTGHVMVKEAHRLVREGPYRFVRHPGYAAFGLMLLGLAIGFSSLVGFISIPGLLWPGLNYRMNVEEKLLTAQFGGEYREHMRTTKRLVPGVW